jgi:hypothetical protein
MRSTELALPLSGQRSKATIALTIANRTSASTSSTPVVPKDLIIAVWPFTGYA